MRSAILRQTVLILILTAVWTAGSGLGLYELAAKSANLPGGPFPGWREAELADLFTPWLPRTRLLPLDRVLHEAQEACFYYRELLGGSLPRPDASRLDVDQ
ncbi:MAG: hypothetical protein ACYDIE_01125 [Candidatus Krumholzibacteriia bacterium]